MERDAVDDDEEWTQETEHRAKKKGDKGRSTKGEGKTKTVGAGWSGRKGGYTFSRAPLSPGSSSLWGSTSPSQHEEGEVLARPRVYTTQCSFHQGGYSLQRGAALITGESTRGE